MTGEEGNHTDGSDTTTTTTTSQSTIPSVYNEKEKEWLVEAHDAFRKRNFESIKRKTYRLLDEIIKNFFKNLKGCINSIDKLKEALVDKKLSESEHLGHETKLLMNRALSSLGKSEYRNFDEFKSKLKEICSRVRN